MSEIFGHFTDTMQWDSQQKTAVSVRDGVLEYLGAEIGEEPADKVFTVYRSPASIARAKDLMAGLPLTDEHVSLDDVVRDPVGSVLDAEVVDFIDQSTNSFLAIQNRVDVTARVLPALESGKRELSLGYKARLVPHHQYDFEQKDIQPHHLAVVTAGRCGSACSFIDRKPTEEPDMPDKLNKAFLDAEGQPNLQQIVEIAQQLPEALKSVPMDKLQEIMPVLQEIVAMAGGGNVPAEPEPVQDEEGAEPEPVQDEEGKEATVSVTDSAEFKDALKAAVAQHTAVIEKARDFVDDAYQFTGKSTAQIMRDTLATEHGNQEFADAELSVAFKLLKKSTADLSNFGDQAAGSLVERVRKAVAGE
jgi:hypothetical protein